MRSSRLFQGILLTALLALSIIIVRYYWQAETLDAIRILPRDLKFLFLFYILVQVLKRWMYKVRNWWDWIYYIGLAAAMLPVFFATKGNALIFHRITDYGSLVLVLPVVLDFYTLLKRKG